MHAAARVVLLLSCLASGACGDGAGPAEPIPSRNELAFTRADGSPIAFAPRVWVWCGPWEGGNVSEPTVHVLVGSADARWELRGVRRDIRIGEPLAFPNTFVWNEPRGADLYVHDPPNELSTQTSGSSGSVVFDEVDCRAGGGVRFRLDAVIGSEFGDRPPVSVEGRFSAPLTGPPVG